jgi:hypothetical protein
MFRTITLTVVGMLIGSGAALATTFTYKSAPLTPASNGGNGATQVTVAFTALAPPAPGKCLMTQRLKSYADSARTLRQLKSGGYIIVKNIVKELSNGQEQVVPMTYAKVCLAKDGATVTGVYQIYATYTSGIVYDEFLANNQQAGGTDIVQFSLYLGGDIPHLYANVSSQAGSWQMTN